jgi:hypothetical protein
VGYTKPETQRLYRKKNPERAAAYREQQRARYAANPGILKDKLKSNAERYRQRYATDPSFKAATAAKIKRWRATIAPEAVAEEHLRECVEMAGGMCPKFIDPARRGAPDRMVLLPGMPVIFVEMKRMKLGKVRPWQERYQADLRALGHRVEVLWSKEDVDEFLATI